jgi:hypothetical protein
VSRGLIKDGILVLTQARDPTADVVIDRLLELGLPVVRLDTADFPGATAIAARWCDNRLASVLHTGAGDVDLGSLRAIWNRYPRPPVVASDLAPQARSFAEAEAAQGLYGALQTSPALWMNRPPAEAAAELKMVQLQAAAARGLRVPDTLVTNAPEAAAAFLSEDDALGAATLYKRLSATLLPLGDGGHAAVVPERIDAAARDRLAHVAVTPCLFQREVPKAYEIRATIVAGRLFAACTADGVTWEPHALPEALEDALIGVVADLGLRFGAIDVIVRPDGEHVFLELNPSGQWAWLDEDLTRVIRDAIVDVLAGVQTLLSITDQ